MDWFLYDIGLRRERVKNLEFRSVKLLLCFANIKFHESNNVKLLFE